MSEIHTLASDSSLQKEVRKSRFRAHAGPINDTHDAEAFIARHAARDATHNCWAWRIGANYRFNDDGEPAGSAGRPILLAIESQALDHVAVVVTRWYGGTKLGIGGLMRAYGGCAAECLRVARRSTRIERVRATVRCDFAVVPMLFARLRDFDALRVAEDGDADGAALDIEVPGAQLDAFAAFVRDLTRGRGTVDVAP